MTCVVTAVESSDRFDTVEVLMNAGDTQDFKRVARTIAKYSAIFYLLRSDALCGRVAVRDPVNGASCSRARPPCPASAGRMTWSCWPRSARPAARWCGRWGRCTPWGWSSLCGGTARGCGCAWRTTPTRRESGENGGEGGGGGGGGEYQSLQRNRRALTTPRGVVAVVCSR